jgi:hypothetical protein
VGYSYKRLELAQLLGQHGVYKRLELAQLLGQLGVVLTFPL